MVIPARALKQGTLDLLQIEPVANIDLWFALELGNAAPEGKSLLHTIKVGLEYTLERNYARNRNDAEYGPPFHEEGLTATAFTKLISRSPLLTQLDLKNFYVPEAGAEALRLALGNLCNLISLSLSVVQSGKLFDWLLPRSESARSLFQRTSQATEPYLGTSLTHFTLGGFSLDDSDVTFFGQWAKESSQLKSLNFKLIYLFNKEEFLHEAFLEAVQSNPSITEFFPSRLVKSDSD